MDENNITKISYTKIIESSKTTISYKTPQISYNELVQNRLRLTLFMIIAHNYKPDVYRFMNEIRFMLQ